jgi:hypothetical protein
MRQFLIRAIHLLVTFVKQASPQRVLMCQICQPPAIRHKPMAIVFVYVDNVP